MLIDQPTAAPTRKVTAVATSGALTTVAVTAIGGFLAVRGPELSEACANEVAVWLVAGGAAALTTTVNFVSGYLRRDRG